MARFRIMEEEHQAAPTSDSREMATSSTDRAQTSDSGPMAIVSRDRAGERKRRQRARATTEEKEMEKTMISYFYNCSLETCANSSKNAFYKVDTRLLELCFAMLFI